MTTTALALLIVPVPTWSAVNLNTQCQKGTHNTTVTGTAADRVFTIASVSKVFTTHWALAQLGPHFRFQTQVHITPVAGDTFDVHLAGGNFPYFNRQMYQFLVAELNRLGVRRINHLTYDENFTYATDATRTVRSSSPTQIMQELRRDTTGINSGFTALKAKAQTLEAVVLPNQLQITIRDIHFRAARDSQPTAATRRFILRSSELYRSLKEFNRNSNNFASDEVFNMLSKRQNFADFVRARIQVPANEIVFRNGSGYPIATSAGRFYNQASCRAVVEMLADLRATSQFYRLGLQDILAVAGRDSDADGESTVTEYYGNGTTSGALIAKTGTVLNTLALAGMLMTPEENVFFHTSYYYNGAVEKAQAYARINSWVQSVFTERGISHELAGYRPKAFMPFDSSSQLQEVPAGPSVP